MAGAQKNSALSTTCISFIPFLVSSGFNVERVEPPCFLYEGALRVELSYVRVPKSDVAHFCFNYRALCQKVEGSFEIIETIVPAYLEHC